MTFEESVTHREEGLHSVQDERHSHWKKTGLQTLTEYKKEDLSSVGITFKKRRIRYEGHFEMIYYEQQSGLHLSFSGRRPKFSVVKRPPPIHWPDRLLHRALITSLLLRTVLKSFNRRCRNRRRSLRDVAVFPSLFGVHRVAPDALVPRVNDPLFFVCPPAEIPAVVGRTKIGHSLYVP